MANFLDYFEKKWNEEKLKDSEHFFILGYLFKNFTIDYLKNIVDL